MAWMARGMRAVWALSFLGLMLVFAGGCAAGSTQVKIGHEPLSPVASKRQGTVFVKPLVDVRDKQGYIGNKRNAYGMVLGHVVAPKGQKVEDLMTQFVAESLQNAGYTAVVAKSATDAPPADCKLVIQGEVVEFWMDLYMEVWHRAGAKLQAVDPATNKVVWEKTTKEGEHRVLWVGATGEYERIVRQAVTKWMNTISNDFASDEFHTVVAK